MDTKKTQKKIAVLIPCYNEADGIADVIQNFPASQLRDAGFALEIIVVDNNSSDNTADIARSYGATVLSEPKPGKGNAVQLGFRSITYDTDYVVMIDGDTTYQPSEILRLIEPLESGFCSVVVGSRLAGKITNGAMSVFNRLGNWTFSVLVRYVYQANVTDVLTGYFAWKREALVRLRPHLTSSDFGIEMDMVTKMAKLGETIYSVPITYTVRSGDSSLHPVLDGFRILKVFMQNMFWEPGAVYDVPVTQGQKQSSRATV